MDQMLSDAKQLVQRLNAQDNVFDSIISETTSLQNRLLVMRQYHEEVSRMNEIANHRPRSTLILGSLLENQRIQNLEQENKELSLSLAEHQSALELIMNKYREQVLIMMKLNSNQNSCNSNTCLETEVKMREKISEMANVMRHSALIDDNIVSKEIEALRSLQVENENLRELLQISGKSYPTSFPSSLNSESFNSTNSNNISFSRSNLFDYNLLNCTPFVKSKDSGIFENEGESGKEVILLPKSKNLYKFQNSFEQININHDNDLNMELRSHLDEESSMNCFRAIITNIQPLDVTRENESDRSEKDFDDSCDNQDDSSKIKAEESDAGSILSVHVFDKNNASLAENGLDNYEYQPKRKKHISKKSFQETSNKSENPLAYLFTQNVKINEFVKNESVQIPYDANNESDADSEVTYTGDDIEDALHELDSIVDDSTFLEDDNCT